MRARRRDPDDERERLERLRGFADAVLERSARAPKRYRFGRSKVFLAALGELNRHTVRLLIEAHREGMLRLSRCDLVPAVDDPSLIRDSEIEHMNATFHFVTVPDTTR